ncbi:hypothetical protein M426DRAFT_320768 [Hypoxylon sp. CI-4A]|nr:hypothetical protein M426DRAFT_320768 [Hypoxylon sp. CI-4A]
MSGFLNATVSKKAVSHAADMGQHIGKVPKDFGKETMAHISRSGHLISDSAKKGNYVGAVTRVVGAAIGIPVGTAIRAVGASISLPFAALGALTQDPKTPRERAVAYAAAANVKWLHKRGLQAHLLDTAELSHAMGLSTDQLLLKTRAAHDESSRGQMAALDAHVADLQVRLQGSLELGAGTLWLVVSPKVEGHEHDQKHDYGRDHEFGRERERRRGRR